MFNLLSSAGIFLLVLNVFGSPYDGDLIHKDYQVIRLQPTTKTDIAFLREVQAKYDFDFWHEPTVPGRHVDIALPKSFTNELRYKVTGNMSFDIIIPDLYQKIMESRQENVKALSKNHFQKEGMTWDAYHEYDEIMNWLDELAYEYKNLVTVENVGESYEGRTMKILKISKGGQNKSAIFVDGGIHAREWISPAVATYIINEILTNSDQFDDILNAVDLYFMPLINPDGYAYTFSDDRMWRKTRSKNEGSLCKGTDPNRNWDCHWGELGASHQPCSETYAGKSPFSEIEMVHVRDQLTRHKENIKVYLSFHSYGQYWIYPWGYNYEVPEDIGELDSLAKRAVNALTDVYGTLFTVGQISYVLYPAAGGSDDYVKSIGIKYSYTVELRDKGQYGFFLPPNQIVPSGKEIFEAYKEILNFVKETYA